MWLSGEFRGVHDFRICRAKGLSTADASLHLDENEVSVLLCRQDVEAWVVPWHLARRTPQPRFDLHHRLHRPALDRLRVFGSLGHLLRRLASHELEVTLGQHQRGASNLGCLGIEGRLQVQFVHAAIEALDQIGRDPLRLLGSLTNLLACFDLQAQIPSPVVPVVDLRLQALTHQTPGSFDASLGKSLDLAQMVRYSLGDRRRSCPCHEILTQPRKQPRGRRSIDFAVANLAVVEVGGITDGPARTVSPETDKGESTGDHVLDAVVVGAAVRDCVLEISKYPGLRGRVGRVNEDGPLPEQGAKAFDRKIDDRVHQWVARSEQVGIWQTGLLHQLPVEGDPLVGPSDWAGRGR